MNYVEENDGFITSSKLKDFIRCPLAYKMKYIDKIEIPEEGESRALIMGRAIDDYVSYGEEYFKDNWNILEPRQRKKNANDLTNSEGQLVLSGIEELHRQEIFDVGGDYETQKQVIGEFKAGNGMKLKLKGTFDRFSLEKNMVRDMKFMRDVTSFEWDADDFGYYFQGAFYHTLASIKYGKDFKMIFDVFSKNIDCSKSCSYEITPERLTEYRRYIRKALNKLAECMEKNEWHPIPEFQRMEKCFSRKGIPCPMYRFCSGTAIQRKFVEL